MRKRDEEGAVVPFVAVVIVLLVTIAAFAVDLGMQRVARRDMQAVADLVALDLVRALEGRTVQELASANPSLEDLAAASASRQEGTVGKDPELSVKVGTVGPDGIFVEAIDPDLVPNAVQVLAETEVAFAFRPGEGRAARNATAIGTPVACYSTATYAARVESGDSSLLAPLSSLLGITVTVADLQGLAQAEIRLTDLLIALDAGTFEEALETELTLREATLAYASALEAASGRTAEVEALERWAALVPSQSLKLEEVLSLDTGLSSGLEGSLNLLDLFLSTVEVANGTSAIALPSVNVGLVGVSLLSGEAQVSRRPSIACGRPEQVRSETNQVSVELSGNLLSLPLGLARVSAPISVRLELEPGAAEAVGLTCPDLDRTIEFLVEEGLATVEVVVGDLADPNALSVGLPLVGGGLGQVARGSLVFRGSQAEEQDGGSITVIGGRYGDTPPLEAGRGTLSFPTLSVENNLVALPGLIIGSAISSLLGDLVSGVVNPLLSQVIGPLVNNLDAVISPALEAQGVSVSGLEVKAIPSSTCGSPRLVR